MTSVSRRYGFRNILLWFLLTVFLVPVVLFLVALAALSYGSEDLVHQRVALESAVSERMDEDSLFVSHTLTLKSGTGLVVECGMLTPVGGTGRVPAFIILGGKATGKDAIQYVLDMHGVVIVAVAYPYDPRPSYSVLELIGDLPAVRKALLEMVPSVRVVTDYLHSRGDVDTSRIVIIGYSFGAPYVPVIASSDRRIDVAMMVYGGGDLGSLIYHNVRRYEGWAFSRLVGTLGESMLSPIEPLRYAEQVSPTPLVMINGTEDEQIPTRNVVDFYESAGEPKVLRWIESGHVHPRNVELTRTIIHTMKEELARLGVLGPLHRD